MTADQKQCPHCSHSAKITTAILESVSGFMVLLIIYEFMRIYCKRSCGLPFFSRRAGMRNSISSDNSLTQMRPGGLATEIIIALPAIQFERRAEGDDEHRNCECPICLGEFREKEWLRLLPSCAHAFHVSCVDVWLRDNSSCPVCRNNLLWDDVTSRRSDPAINLLETLPREEPLQVISHSPHVM